MTMTSPRALAQSSYFHAVHPDDPGTRSLDIMPDQPAHLSDVEDYGTERGECVPHVLRKRRARPAMS